MPTLIRTAQSSDSDTLWVMLYYAAHMAEDGELSPFAAQTNAFLRPYVADWGQPDDLGFVAEHAGQAVGAVWSRVLAHEYQVAVGIPELALAVLPAYHGRGIGSQLLATYLAAARQRFSAITLSVRATNPALRLYQRAGFVVLDTITNRVGSQSYTMRLDFTTTSDCAPQ